MHSGTRLKLFAASCAVVAATAACGEPEEMPQDGAIVLNILCVDDGCGPTGTLIAQHKRCDGTVLNASTSAGVTLDTASGGTPFSVSWAPVEPGDYCVNAMLETSAGTIVSNVASGADVAITIFHGETVTVGINLGTLN